jgi:hypothetical protein
MSLRGFIYPNQDESLIGMVRQNRSPKGLFDPYYVPEKLLHRDRELDAIRQSSLATS